MTDFLYVPFNTESKEELVSPWNDWQKVSKNQNRPVTILYSGNKEVAPQKLPPTNDTIYVLIPGKPGPLNPIAKELSSNLARKHESTSSHLKFNDGKNIIFIPQLAQKMVEDGLLKNKKCKIKLCFFDVTDLDHESVKYAAQSFMDTLKNSFKDKRSIRVDYYVPESSRQSEKTEDSNYNFIEKKCLQFLEQSKTPKNSIYSNSGEALGFSSLKTALDKYHQYKSVRLCGLSGILGLNGFFSSNESLNLVNQLKKEKSTVTCYELASQFISQHPNHKLAFFLKDAMVPAVSYKQAWNENYMQVGEISNRPGAGIP
ncbi:MAG: hypothetical protein Q8M40_00020 [Legionella sp.]|nr:hypothetical protein [Legionella sp.]